MPRRRLLIAGGGIGGLSAALAAGRAGWDVALFERASAFGEVGAGIQIGPNVTRILQGWGLRAALDGVVAYPTHLQVRSAVSGGELGRLELGDAAVVRHGAPYATVHRADLHGLLLEAVRSGTQAQLHLDSRVQACAQSRTEVRLQTAQGDWMFGDLLLGADGLWSSVRQWLLDDGLPRVTGHVAYRAMVPQDDLPAGLRSRHVTVWLGRDLHVVQYPVRRGDWLNVVGVLHAVRPPQDSDGRVLAAEHWDHGADAATLRAALSGSCAPLQDLVRAIAHWRMWVLCDRPPIAGPREQGHGRVALLGDAAHPMRPYLAQGAGMAIEDAAELGRLCADGMLDAEALVHHYAHRRWARNARVQARSIRNGRIFHAHGLVRLGRDTALRLLGAAVLDLPWLYGYGA